MPKRKLMTYGKQARSIISHSAANLKSLKRDSASPSKKQNVSMAEPTEENIELVISFTECSREVAIKYLKAKNNNLEQAVSALLDGDNLTQDAWDESAWGADRNDSNLQPLGASTAPTRGPSPVGSFRHPTSREQEDADLASAMAASTGQEQGVIRADGTTAPIYGPEYNARDWALVRTTPMTTEITPDVSAVDRRHDAQPRFLKPSNDYLPNFLTICHSIPAARNALLVHDYTRMTYGSNPEWWKGQEIQLPRIVHASDGSPTDPQLARYDDFIAETQRLMAFLDSSNRAYATTTNLEKYSGMRYHGRSQISSAKTNVNTFIEELSQATFTVSQKTDVEDLFALRAGSDTGEINDHIMEVFHFDVEGDRSLAAILDDVLWDIDGDDEPEDRFIEKLPGVIVMRCKQHTAPTLQVKAPGVMYMDKYLKENLEQVKPLRQQIARGKRRLNKINEVEQQLKTWQYNQKPIDALQMLAQTKAQFHTEQIPNGVAAGVLDVAEQLEKVISSVNEKLDLLNEERSKAQAALAELSSSPQQLQDHRYTLAGIATKPGITYVLRPQAEDEQTLLDHGDETSEGMQWWRIEYMINGTTATLNRTKVPSYDALAAIEHEHNTALLVYANDDAFRPPHSTMLSSELHAFIQADNQLFEQELNEVPPPSYAFDTSMNEADRPLQSIERSTSMDSLTAQHNSPDMGAFDEDPTQHATFNLGYGADMHIEDPPVAEIHVPGSRDEEMTEVSHTQPSGVAEEYLQGQRRDSS
ncbi:hypothetical protein AMS68_005354 [Peltaster fructicola]|uniref:UBA domain-containing protein n=1 Tax=Peltaster fructicola TaxID=286661 RepID=A0A6H0XYL1_9PEZI|nr:hypothetical protein AMS68_005354 [Peltaster fructicola]